MRICGCKIVDFMDIKKANGYLLVYWNHEYEGKSDTSFFQIIHMNVRYSWWIPVIDLERCCKIPKRVNNVECFSSAEEAVKAAKAELRKRCWLPTRLLVDQSVLEHYSTF